MGQTKTIEIKGANKKQLKKAKWSVKSGKKYIKIKISKSKASIKVTGKKTGKAKVLCKVAGKKLVCKITVKTAKSKSIKPSATPVNKATPVPVATLAPTPQATIMPVESERPTHIPTEDKLMVEPAKCTELPIMDEQGFPIERIGDYVGYYFYGTNILRSDIELLTFSSKIDVPSDAIGQIDVSAKQNKSVIAWYTDVDNDDYYEMTIAQEGGVIANEDSSYFCSEMIEIRGLENLYTDNVKDLTRAFYEYMPGTNDGSDYLDLGDYFNTSKVEIFDEMFGRTGSIFNRVTIRLGKQFDVGNCKSAEHVFFQALNNKIKSIIVSNQDVETWVLSKKPWAETTVVLEKV